MRRLLVDHGRRRGRHKRGGKLAHMPLDGAVSSFAGRLLIAQINVLLAWVLYLGLEPVVRRCSPEALVSWTRLIAGRVRECKSGGL